MTPENLEKAENSGKTDVVTEKDRLTQLDEAFKSFKAETDARLKSQDAAISRKEAENRRLKEQLENREEDVNLQRAYVAALAGAKGQPEEVVEDFVKTNQPDLLKQYDLIVKQSEAKRQRREMEMRVDAIQKRVTDLGLTPNSKDFLRMKNLATTGQFELAEMELTELEQAKVPKDKVVTPAGGSSPPLATGGKTETEDERIDRLAEEKARAKLEAEGLLRTDTGSPSGSKGGKNYTQSQIDAMSTKEFMAEFPGGTEDVYKAIAEGRIR